MPPAMGSQISNPRPVEVPPYKDPGLVPVTWFTNKTSANVTLAET